MSDAVVGHQRVPGGTLGQNPVDHQLIYQSWFALTSTLVHPSSTSVDNCLARSMPLQELFLRNGA